MHFVDDEVIHEITKLWITFFFSLFKDRIKLRAIIQGKT